MSFYDDPNNVEKYIQMCNGYDGSRLYGALAKALPPNSSLLELGSGGGFDIEVLKKRYSVTGSDLSDEFLKVSQEKNPDVSFLKLDALELSTDEKFDCLYSNKVLHHLTEVELIASLERQRVLLTSGGIIAHSFWLGDDNQIINGLLFTYYSEAYLLDMLSTSFEIVSTLKYGEFEDNDSLFLIARLKD